MIIRAASQITSTDLGRFGWVGLRRFHNVEMVQNAISVTHKIPSNNQNVKKQATQIKYCLQKAREYFESAQHVSLVTKLVLLYYSVMCLALAEILFKQTGDSSLDRARDEHRHHGLSFDLAPPIKGLVSLRDHASALRAKPTIRFIDAKPERFGAFELWHRSCRSLPLVGMRADLVDNLTMTKLDVLFTQDDDRLPLLPISGITLLECMALLPEMQNTMISYGVAPDVVRATLTSMAVQNQAHSIQIAVHPTNKDKVDEFIMNLKFNPNDVDHVNMQEGIVGGIITLNSLSGRCDLPAGAAINSNNTYFWPRHIPLNEFGLMYVALYIVGNYARYFPDCWIRDVDAHAPLALAIEELVSVVENRMSLLAFSELAQNYFVPES